MGRVLPAVLLALVAVLAALASSDTPPQLAEQPGDEAASRDAISDLIETVRRIILEGSEDPYVPVLDPLRLESQELILTESGTYEVKGGIRNMVTTGLGDFDADGSYGISIILLRLTVTVDITIPRLVSQGQYSLNALLGEVVNLYGNGNFNMELSELNATIVTQISIGVTSSKVRSLTTTLDVGDFKLSADGLMEGGPVDDIFNLAVNQIGKSIFDSQKSVLEDYLASMLEDPINEVIKDIGLSDLLCLLFGNCGGDGGGGGDDSNSTDDIPTEDSIISENDETDGERNREEDKNVGAFVDSVHNGAGVRDRLSTQGKLNF